MWLRSLLDDQRTNTMSRTGSSRQSSDEQRSMQDSICSDNLLAGITSILVGDDEHSLKQQGCSVLATLAWSNPRSSSRVATWPGILDAIAKIISDPRHEMAISQEQASLVLGNCSANSKVAAETFAGHRGQYPPSFDLLKVPNLPVPTFPSSASASVCLPSRDPTGYLPTGHLYCLWVSRIAHRSKMCF